MKNILCFSGCKCYSLITIVFACTAYMASTAIKYSCVTTRRAYILLVYTLHLQHYFVICIF